MRDPELSFVHNMAKAFDALGSGNIPVAYMLARTAWDSQDDRDAMLRTAAITLGVGGNQ